MGTRKLEWPSALESSDAAQPVASQRAEAPGTPQEIWKKWLRSAAAPSRDGKFIDRVKKIAQQTREAQRFEKRCVKQVALNHVNARLKAIADGIEAAIEKEAKEIGTGVLTYRILHPDSSVKSVDSLQLPDRPRVLIFEDDIRKTPAFAYLTGKCTRIGVKVELVEQWSNIAWNPYLGGNAAFVWQLTISGW